MTDNKLLMQQALDLLENHVSNYKPNDVQCDVHTAVINALKEAISKPAAAADHFTSVGKVIAQPEKPSLLFIDELAVQYCTSYASPNHVTFSVQGLQRLIQAIAQPVKKPDLRYRLLKTDNQKMEKSC